MEFGGKCRAAIERGLIAIVLSMLVLSASLVFSIRGALAADVGALIKQLDRDEWQIVSEAVINRLPNLIDGKEEQAHFKEVMKRSQQVAAMAEALKFGDYEGLGSLSAGIIADDLENMVANRFGEDSRLYKSIQIFKSDPALAKELTRAALNADAYAARQAIHKSLKEYAQKHADELRNQGEKFWKDMFRSVIPGGSRLAGLGVDPVGLYLQGIKDWSDFTSQTRIRFNNTMLDCLAIRYRKIRNDGGSGYDARLEIENFDTGTGIGNNFNCSIEMDKLEGRSGDKSILQQIVGFFTRTGRSTAALDELGMTSGEIIDLIEQFESDGGRDRHGPFSSWLQKRLLKNIKTRAKELTDPIMDAQKKAADKQLTEANRLMAAIEAEINKLESKKQKQPQQEKPDDKSDQPVAGTQEQDTGKPGGPANEGGGSGKEKPEPPKVTVQCDKLTALISSVQRRISSGRVDSPDGLIAELAATEASALKEGNCAAEVFADGGKSRARLGEIAILRRKVTAAINSCDIGAIPSLKAEISRVSPSFFDSEISLLETMKTAVSTFKAGRATYDANKYRAAKRQLLRALSAFRELPAGSCQTFKDRAQKGVDLIEKIEAQQARVSRAIARCDTDELKKIIGAYKRKKHQFYKSSIARIKAALPKCEKDDGIIAEGKFCELARTRLDAARADFKANRLKRAWSRLRKLDGMLVPAKTKRCPELKGKVRQGLANIDVLRSEDSRLQQAIADCKVEKLHSLRSRYLGKKHAWYAEASVRARDGIGGCALKQEADCRNQARDMGKVFASIEYKENGSYSCHTCEKGQKPEGNVCVPDREAAVADCRRTAASQGKVYAKTEIRNDGTSICHWCEPGQVYRDGQCGVPGAHAEVACRQDAARKGKVFARVEVYSNGQHRCHWCERGHTYVNGKCWKPAALAEAKCRRDAARRGKVFARVEVYSNGQYRCQWCEPGQYYRNGQCHSRVVRTCPNGFVLLGTLCFPQGGAQQGGAQRGTDCRANPMAPNC